MENLPNSQPKGKRSISQTSPRTAEVESKLVDSATLEILTQSFFMAQQAGYKMEVTQVEGCVTVKIHGVAFRNGQLVSQASVKQAVTQPESVTQ